MDINTKDIQEEILDLLDTHDRNAKAYFEEKLEEARQEGYSEGYRDGQTDGYAEGWEIGRMEAD